MRSFNNYCWDKEDEIGSGATCEVYKGFNKVTGEIVAVKVLKKMLLEQEIDMTKKFDHENIVKLLDHGDFKPGRYCLILEYCSEGDLEVILTAPRNSSGLCDEDFLMLLDCINKFLKEFRKNKVVHRDIKPLNICCHVMENGRKVFKIIDLGGARELSDNEIAISIIGTPEYCHPHMYSRVYFESNEQRESHGENAATLDLWSTGITLYKCALSQMPFMPYEYSRRNYFAQNTFYTMGMNKPNHAIGAFQRGPNDEITWIYRLHTTSSLSRALRHIVTQLIRGLLRHSNCWNFIDFFNFCDDLASRHCIQLFCPLDGHTQLAYLSEINPSTLRNEFRFLWTLRPRNYHLLDCEDDATDWRRISEETDHSDSLTIFYGGHQLYEDLPVHLNSQTNVFICLPQSAQQLQEMVMKGCDTADDAVQDLDAEFIPPIQNATPRIDMGETHQTVLKQLLCVIRVMWKHIRQIQYFKKSYENFSLTVVTLIQTLQHSANQLNRQGQFIEQICKDLSSDISATHDLMRKDLQFQPNFITEQLNSSFDLNVLHYGNLAESILKRIKLTSKIDENRRIALIQRILLMQEKLKQVYAVERDRFFEFRSQFANWYTSCFIVHRTALQNLRDKIEILLHDSIKCCDKSMEASSLNRNMPINSLNANLELRNFISNVDLLSKELKKLKR